LKAAVVTKYGAPGVLRISELPEVPLQNDEVKIRVKAIGLNFADVLARLGVYPGVPKAPFVPGIEISGIITQTGRDVRKWRRGDRVIAFPRFGGYAEYINARHDRVYPLPRRMNFEEAAAIGVVSLTAYHALVTLGHLRRGEKVLIHAAAGGVGIAAIQIARHLGADIFATASTDEKLALARSHGAAHLLNYAHTDFAEAIRKETNGYGVDIVLDSVGGDVFRKGWNLLPPMGRYVLYGFSAATRAKSFSRMKALKEILAAPILFPHTLLSRNVSLSCFNLMYLTEKAEYLRNAFRIILDWHANGILRPVIGARFPFEKIADAQALLQSRNSTGKIIVTVG